MVLMTDPQGNTGIYNEERVVRMARQQSLRSNICDVYEAIAFLNKNDRGEVWQLDNEYIEGISDDKCV